MKLSDKDVIYCDNHLLLLNKNAGLLTQPTRFESNSLELLGKHYLKNRYQKKGNVFLEALHRLDRPVSGVVLFARTTKALTRLQLAQRQRRFKKHYLAIVEGDLSQGEWVDHLKHVRNRTIFHPDGKLCSLKFRALKSKSNYTLVSIDLETGRYHQIRAQFGFKGHPIVGDFKYGSKCISQTLFLHHESLAFPHPISGDIFCFHAALPSSWSQWEFS